VGPLEEGHADPLLDDGGGRTAPILCRPGFRAGLCIRTSAVLIRLPAGGRLPRPAPLWWLSDRSQAAANFVTQYLLTHSAAGNNVSGGPVTVPAPGLAHAQVLPGLAGG
jgi:hypothetical protein